MEPTTTEDTRTKALNTIRLFCQKPYNQHGKKRTSGDRKGWYEFHDWGHLVLRLHHLYYGTMLSNDDAATIAQPLRKEFPNSREWAERVNRAGVHEKILEVFEKGVEARNSRPAAAPEAVAATSAAGTTAS